jgi:hypothetical protein
VIGKFTSAFGPVDAVFTFDRSEQDLDLKVDSRPFDINLSPSPLPGLETTRGDTLEAPENGLFLLFAPAASGKSVLVDYMASKAGAIVYSIGDHPPVERGVMRTGHPAVYSEFFEARKAVLRAQRGGGTLFVDSLTPLITSGMAGPGGISRTIQSTLSAIDSFAHLVKIRVVATLNVLVAPGDRGYREAAELAKGRVSGMLHLASNVRASGPMLVNEAQLTVRPSRDVGSFTINIGVANRAS